MAGALSLSCMEAERTWRDETVPVLGVFGRLLVSALDYRDAERSERQAIAEATQVREQLAHLARVEAVGAMSVAVTHEVNQPLAAIANYVRAGRRRLADGEPVDRAKLDGILDKIGGQVALASDVLDRLRALVRRREPREDRIDLAQLIGRALRFVELDCRQGGIQVETALAPGLPPVLGDGIQIKQVIMNLAHNAIVAMAEVPARQRVLRIEARPADDGLRRGRRRRSRPRRGRGRAGCAVRAVPHVQGRRARHRPVDLPHPGRGARRQALARGASRRRRLVPVQPAAGQGRRPEAWMPRPSTSSTTTPACATRSPSWSTRSACATRCSRRDRSSSMPTIPARVAASCSTSAWRT